MLCHEAQTMNGLRTAAVALILCFLGLPAPALDPSRALTQLSHENWQNNRGLPQNAVNAIVQGPDGYLWCATQEGLVRFDGVRFEVFDKWNVPVLTNNNIRALLLDREGFLWIGTNGGGLLRMKEGRFDRFTTREGLVYDNVTALCEAPDGSIWIGTYGGGLSRLKGGSFSNFTTRDGLTHDGVLSLAADRDGTVWVGTNGGGLCSFREGRFGSPRLSSPLPSPFVYSLSVSPDDGLWIGTYGGGLCHLRGSELTTYTHKDGLSNDRITALHQDADGCLWIGTFGGGICRRAGERWDRFSTDEGLPYNVVRSFCEDREGNLWVGLDGGGLSRFHDGSFTSISEQEGLSSDYAIGIYETRSGDVWITTNGGGLNLLRGGRITHFTTKEGLPNDLIRSICEDPAGGLWVATDGGGLARLQGRSVKVITTADGLSSNRVIAVLVDHEGTVWAGTNGGGLNRIRDGKVSVMSSGRGRAGMVNLVREDSRLRLWVGTYGGGLSLVENGRFASFPGQDAIGNAIVSAILEDPDGTFWLGTIGQGLLRLRDGKVDRFTKRDGLFDDVAYEVLDDGIGHLWMSGNRGVYRVARSDLEGFASGRLTKIPCVSYGEPDGMKSAECNGGFVPAGIRTRDGRLWFPTTRGVAVVDPSRLKKNPLPPPVMIERVVLNGRPLDPGDRLSLPPGRNSLELHYTGLSFVAPEKVFFTYQLEGFDPEWVQAGTRRVAYYTNIPPGYYTFRVKACNNDGAWNETGALLRLRQRPFFYQTAWFYALCALCTLVLVFAAVRIRVRSLEARQVELEDLVRVRTRELETANERLHLLSTLDGLTGLANRRTLDEHLEKQWRQLHRSGEPISLLMADLDAFKAFNDTYGHQLGDDCLARAASVMRRLANRAGDLVARYGGEEFVVVLSGTGEAGATALAENVRAQVEALAIPHPSSPVSPVVTLSIGVASATPAAGGSWQELLGEADQALYRAKQGGRNRVCSVNQARPARP
jgi:diguanylate cyclase (GGDEF)-like protein